MRNANRLVLLLACLLLAIQPDDGVAQNDAPKPAKKIALIAFGSEDSPMEIGAFSESYLDRKLKAAQEIDADVVVIEMDSPGGLLDEGLSMADTIREISWARTVAYVPRQSLSAGSFLCLACDEIVIAENGFIGDAGPIFLDDNFMFQHASEKVRSDLAAKIRKIAEDKGRPPALAEAMVDMDLEVFKVTHADTDEIGFMSDAELDSLEDPTEWKKGPLVQASKKGLFLEVAGPTAVDIGLADGVINSRGELAKRYGVQPNEITVLDESWVDALVIILNYKSVTVLLFIIGLIAAYVELAAPGIGIGGLIAGLCFGLFFWSRFLGGTAGWLEILLFLGGIVFIACELFVIPGFGVPGFGGILLIVASLVMASQRWSGTQGVSTSALTTSLFTICVAGVVSIVGMWLASKYFGGLKLFQALTLEPPTVVAAAGTMPGGVSSTSSAATTGSVSNSPARAGSPAIGDEGVADSMLRPSGRAKFDGQFYDVVTDGSFVDPGARVRVIRVNGIQVTVRQIEDV